MGPAVLTVSLFVIALYSGNTNGDDKGTGLVRIVIENEQLTAVEAWEAFEELAPHISLKKIFTQGELQNIKTVAELPKIKEWVIAKNRRDYAMNVDIAFQLLGKVGTLLKISYAGCKGFSCQVATADVHSNYQDMCEKSYITSNEFVVKAARALKYHRYALKWLDRGNLARAFKYIMKSATMANGLQTEAQKMVDLASELKEKAYKAFLEAVGNDVGNKKEIDKFKERMANATGHVNKINAMIRANNILEQQTEQQARAAGNKAVEWETMHKEEAKKKIKTNEICKVTPVPVISISVVTITRSVKTCYTKVDEADVKRQARALEGFEKNLKDARNRELEHLKAKRDIQKKTRDLLGMLASDISEVDFTKTTGDTLERAKQSLEIAIKTLSMVKTIFLKAVSFWSQVVKSAEARGTTGQTMQDFKEMGLDEEDEFRELLIESGMSWIALGAVCVDARASMAIVKQKVTEDFISLPNAEQALKLIETCKPILDETVAMIKKLGGDLKETEKKIEVAEKANQEEDALSKPGKALAIL